MKTRGVCKVKNKAFLLQRPLSNLSFPPLTAVVLSACPDADAPLLLPEVPVQDVMYLVSFIYRGQVDVHQQHIASFLRTAKHLHVLGLEEGDRVGGRVVLYYRKVEVHCFRKVVVIIGKVWVVIVGRWIVNVGRWFVFIGRW